MTDWGPSSNNDSTWNDAWLCHNCKYIHWSEPEEYCDECGSTRISKKIIGKWQWRYKGFLSKMVQHRYTLARMTKKGAKIFKVIETKWEKCT